MNIALDYDGTFTADPKFWLAFIVRAVTSGHSVSIVTMRYPSECTPAMGFIDLESLHHIVDVVCTSRKAKKPYCVAQGHDFNIWIDDHPEALLMDAAQAWPTTEEAPEGKPHDPSNDAPLKAKTKKRT